MNKFLACGVLVVGMMAAPGVASARSDGGHCPPPVSGYVVWDVTTAPYQADNNVDEQGNNNGFACARPTTKTVEIDGVVYRIYNFIDDAGAIPN